MYCGKCGAQNLDDANFCKECGAPLNGASPAHIDAEPVQSKQISKKSNRKIGIAVMAIVAIVLVVIIVNLFSGRSYKSVVNKFIEAIFSADGKTIVSLIPDEVIKVVREEEDMTEREFIKFLKEKLEDEVNDIESYYEDWSYSYEIIEVEDYSKKALKSLQEDYEDEFDVEVKAAKTVTVELTITGDDDELSNTLEVKVIKVGRSWYIDVLGTSF